MQRALISWLSRHHGKIIAAGVIGAAVSVVALFWPGLRENYSIASFVGSDNREFDTLEEFIATFGGSELVLIAVRGSGAQDDETLACLEQILSRTEALPAVQKASAITQLPLLGRSLLTRHPLVKGVLVSHDDRTATVILQMVDEGESGDLRRQTVGGLRRIVAEARRKHPALEIILTGPYVTMFEMFEFVREDLRLFSICVAALMILVLYALIGSWGAAFFAVGVAAAAVLCTLGLTIGLGVNMSLTTQMIVIMIAVLAVATCVHLVVGHREAGGSVVLTLSNLMVPCSAVILTSAAGFASVRISDIQPIRDFGALMVLGLLLALLLAFAAIFALDGRRSGAVDPRAILHRLLAAHLGRLAGLSVAHKAAVILFFTGAALLLAIPIPTLQFESDFVKNFRKESTVRRGYEFIEQNLAPLGSIELVVYRRNGNSIINLHTIQACDRVAVQALATHEPITKVISILDVLRLSGTGLPGSELELQLRFRAAKGFLRTMLGADAMSNFVTEDLSALRVSLRAREGASVREKIEMSDDILQKATAAFGPEYDVTVTGLYYFYATLITGLLGDQSTTFVITLIAIFVITALFLRSWKLAAIGMIPNLFPMVACLGLMGWLGIPLNMATSMMLAISLGIAVDDTIHYLWRFRRELQCDGNVAAAVVRSHRSVGLACVFTTLVITGGFWILCFSRFLPTAYFGVLIGLTMFVALAADLMLLPVLLSIFVSRTTVNATRGFATG
ncbi:MAG: efflux RND transporter permease subunit, partial [Pseudomonadales bacterium]